MRNYAVFELDGIPGTVVEQRLSGHGIDLYKAGHEAIAVNQNAVGEIKDLLDGKGIGYDSTYDMTESEVNSWFDSQLEDSNAEKLPALD